MGQILSHSEIEAVLSALDLSPNPVAMPTPVPAANPTAADELQLYDFEHPEPLRKPQFDSLRLFAAAGSQKLQVTLSNVLRSAGVVHFLGVEQSTYHDYLATAEQPGCLAAFGTSDAAGIWLVDLGRTLAFTIIDCMLGGQPADNQSAAILSRPFTDVETRLIDKAIQAIMPDLVGDLMSRHSSGITRLVSDSSLLVESASNAAVALVSFDVSCGPIQGLMQLCIPWKEVEKTAQSMVKDSTEFRELMRSSAAKVPVTATASVAHLKLPARELAQLSPGDVLLTDHHPS